MDNYSNEYVFFANMFLSNIWKVITHHQTYIRKLIHASTKEEAIEKLSKEDEFLRSICVYGDVNHHISLMVYTFDTCHLCNQAYNECSGHKDVTQDQWKKFIKNKLSLERLDIKEDIIFF
jgi:hypothetical protein